MLLFLPVAFILIKSVGGVIGGCWRACQLSSTENNEPPGRIPALMILSVFILFCGMVSLIRFPEAANKGTSQEVPFSSAY